MSTASECSYDEGNVGPQMGSDSAFRVVFPFPTRLMALSQLAYMYAFFSGCTDGGQQNATLEWPRPIPRFHLDALFWPRGFEISIKMSDFPRVGSLCTHHPVVSFSIKRRREDGNMTTYRALPSEKGFPPAELTLTKIGPLKALIRGARRA